MSNTDLKCFDLWASDRRIQFLTDQTAPIPMERLSLFLERYLSAECLTTGRPVKPGAAICRGVSPTEIPADTSAMPFITCDKTDTWHYLFPAYNLKADSDCKGLYPIHANARDLEQCPVNTGSGEISIRARLDGTGKLEIPSVIRDRLGLSVDAPVDVIMKNGSLTILPVSGYDRLWERVTDAIVDLEAEIPVMGTEIIRAAQQALRTAIAECRELLSPGTGPEKEDEP